jgi:SWI/SNF-related matrix-associated actin-dependent regulator of chromatin subfamily B protein 1
MLSSAIAHAIREQVFMYAKSLLLVGHKFTENVPVEDDDLRTCFMTPLEGIEKPDHLKFGPFVSYISQYDIDRLEKEREREGR